MVILNCLFDDLSNGIQTFFMCDYIGRNLNHNLTYR